MPRPPSLLPALVAVAATALSLPLLALGAPAVAADHVDAAHDRVLGAPPVLQAARTAHAHRPREEATPLAVTLDEITPSYLPEKGPVEVSGRVTNNSDEPWTGINLHAFLGSSPITSSVDLAEQTALPETTEVGDRIYAPGTFDTVDSLDPGQSLPFRLTLKHRYLVRDLAGVYWFGVHALGTSSAGHDQVADGRARTFLPLPPEHTGPARTALVVPLRHPVHHAANGRVADARGWARALSAGGSLSALADFGSSASGHQLTWLVDPAVPEAVGRLVAGNPARTLEDTPGPGSPDLGSSPGEVDSSEGAGSGSDSGEGEEGDGSASPDPNPATVPGRSWLSRMKDALVGQEVLALPYGDLDVSAASERAPALVERAVARSDRLIEEWGVRTSPGVASPDGFLDPEALHLLEGDETVLVDQGALGPDGPPVARAGGVRLVATSPSAAAGGPAPGDQLSALAMRQRLLSEAALTMLEEPHRPLVVVLPAGWTPDDADGFFDGLDVDWVRLTTVGDAARGRATPLSPDQLVYPEELAAEELPQVNFLAADRLQRVGRVLQDVLTRNQHVAAETEDQALSSLAYGARAHPDANRVRTDQSSTWIERRLHKIKIKAPPGVTLSSASGRFAATLVNRLEHPVSVRVRALTDPGLDVEQVQPPGVIDMAAGGRQTVVMQARVVTPGVHRIRLQVTTDEGVALGSADGMPIRSAEVSAVIWVIIGVGLALLFGAVVVRVVRRVRGEARE